MNCVIPGVNVKVLSKAIQALSKIGDELQLEPWKDYLMLKTANMTTTAYSTFKFLDTFFSSYEIEDSEKLDELSCIIPMKAILGVFKSHGHKDKRPEFILSLCKIELEDSDMKIVFKFKYRHDVTVIRSLYLSDGQILNITYNTTTSNQVSANAHLFSQVLTNFQLGDDDMSIEVSSNKALMRNYITGDVNKSKGIRSQLTLTTGEFNSFKVSQETSITFSLKPFRSAIHFAESSNLNVVLNFETSGKPVILVIRNPTFEADFVISTLSTDHISQSSLSTSVTLKKKQSIKDKANMTIQDQQVLESINWDNDFDLQSENDIQRKSQSEKARYNSNLTVNNNIQNNNDVIIEEHPNLGNNVDKDDDVVPDSPESPNRKRIKNIFGRCYETTFHETMIDMGNILAPDSDPEMDDDF